MIFTNFIFMVIIKSVLGSHCDKLGILIYEDLGCTPNTKVCDNTCPTKYSCKGLEPTPKNCIFRGKTYQENEIVASNFSKPFCRDGCICHTEVDKSQFLCAVVDCFDELTPGCSRKFSLGQCCPVGTNCPPFNNVTCEFEGKSYKEGEKFSTEKACVECVCQKGFKGKLEEPFCKRLDCITQLGGYGSAVQNSCAPFYSTNVNNVLCCPNTWICPNGREIIKGVTETGASCRFGNKTLSVGQKFKKVGAEDVYGNSVGNVTCECVVPPLLRCLKD